jgi:class III poly(R)-hydroxyalkanoic acid synthase PhaE subunit
MRGSKMSDDFMRQWQQWASALDPSRGASWWGPPPPQAMPYADLFERFAAAAGAASGPEAARAFGDWLRDQFRDPGALWGNQLFTSASWSAPAFGPMREHQLRAERMTRAWQRAEEARQRCARLWSDMLREAADTFSRGLTATDAPAAPAAPVTDARRLYDQWINAAEAAYARMARSTDFVKAQGDFINFSGEMRRELSDYAAGCAKFLDLPTRAELDSVHERLRALQTTVDKLVAQLAQGGKAA